MPGDKDTALALQKKFYGDPQGLAQHLVKICLNSVGIVREVFIILDRFSTFDVGCRFLNLLPDATLLGLAKTKNGKALCQMLLLWFLNQTPLNSSDPICPGIDFVIELKRLKDAIDNSSPKENGNPYYTIDANIVLESEAISILDKIGPLYFAKVGKKFNVNSGTRDAYRQAEAMWVKYPRDKIFSEYPQRKLINEILEAIKKEQAAGKNNAGIVQAMTDAIQNQINRKEYISKHLTAGCIDIATLEDIPTGVDAMTGSEQKIMMEIAIKVTGGTAKKEDNPPHIHIQFK